MSNKPPNDFDFDDDIFGNGNGDEHPDEFDFGEGPDLPTEDELPTGVIRTAPDDMPIIEVEPEPGGVSRSFVVLAIGLIAIFAISLIAVILLATRPTGPSDLELTATQVVLLNATVEAQLVATQTQSAEILALTLTAAAASPTPEPTLTPTVPTPEPTDTPPPTEDPTLLAATQQALAFAQTATALANPTPEAATSAPIASPTTPPTIAATPLPTGSPTNDFSLLFATQVAFATQSAGVDNAILATLSALSTAAASNPQQPIVVTAGPEQQSTQAALGGQSDLAATAGAVIDTALEQFAQTAAPLQTQIALLTPAAQGTASVLSTQVAGLQSTQAAVQQQVGSLISTVFAVGTPAAVQTLDALATQIGVVSGLPTSDPQATQIADLLATQGAMSLELVNLQATLNAAGPIAQGTLDAAATQIAAANQQLFLVQAMQATQGAQATQVALATRDALVQQLISGTVIAIVPTSPLDAVNQTATALATYFQTPVAVVSTPEAGTLVPTAAFPTAIPTPTTLPETGLFDEVGGDSLGVLAIALVGLVGVIVAARVLRRKNGSDDDSDE